MIPSDLPLELKRLQFPLKLSFAMSINKAQVQTSDCGGINLQNDCFKHGQLHVACSRVRCPKKIIHFAPNENTKNIVYR